MDNQTKWSDLLQAAVTEPGLILKAYTAFWGYSLDNRIAAMFQCAQRNIQPGPINTYPGWQKLNRQVKKGEKAVWLCMPLTRKKQSDKGEDETVITTFVWKPHWFVVAQTDGEPVTKATAVGIMNESKSAPLDGSAEAGARIATTRRKDSR